MYAIDVPVDDYITLDIHFVHRRVEIKAAIPVLFVHGCMSDTKLHRLKPNSLTGAQGQDHSSSPSKFSPSSQTPTGPGLTQPSTSSPPHSQTSVLAKACPNVALLLSNTQRHVINLCSSLDTRSALTRAGMLGPSSPAPWALSIQKAARQVISITSVEPHQLNMTPLRLL
jgi:hypothetical protein